MTFLKIIIASYMGLNIDSIMMRVRDDNLDIGWCHLKFYWSNLARSIVNPGHLPREKATYVHEDGKSDIFCSSGNLPHFHNILCVCKAMHRPRMPTDYSGC